MKKLIRRLLGREESATPSSAPAARPDFEANAEMMRARLELRKSKGERREAEAVAERLRRENADNHFAAAMRNALRGVIE